MRSQLRVGAVLVEKPIPIAGGSAAARSNSSRSREGFVSMGGNESAESIPTARPGQVRTSNSWPANHPSTEYAERSVHTTNRTTNRHAEGYRGGGGTNFPRAYKRATGGGATALRAYMSGTIAIGTTSPAVRRIGSMSDSRLSSGNHGCRTGIGFSHFSRKSRVKQNYRRDRRMSGSLRQ